MSYTTVHPIISGVVGILIAGWCKKRWARWVPQRYKTHGRNRLLKEHKTTIEIANALGFFGFLTGALPYWTGWLSDHDWRGVGLAFGLLSFLTFAGLAVPNAPRGIDAVKECLVAYAISQKTPPRLLFILMGLMLICGLISAASFRHGRGY